MKLAAVSEADYVTVPADDLLPENITTEAELRQAIAQLETQMREAAKKFEFERAAGLRDRLRALQQRQLGGLLSAIDGPGPLAAAPSPPAPPAPVADAAANPVASSLPAPSPSPAAPPADAASPGAVAPTDTAAPAASNPGAAAPAGAAVPAGAAANRAAAESRPKRARRA
jgi:hypothetical protein